MKSPRQLGDFCFFDDFLFKPYRNIRICDVVEVNVDELVFFLTAKNSKIYVKGSKVNYERYL